MRAIATLVEDWLKQNNCKYNAWQVLGGGDINATSFRLKQLNTMLKHNGDDTRGTRGGGGSTDLTEVTTYRTPQEWHFHLSSFDLTNPN